MPKCPACLVRVEGPGYRALARHFDAKAAGSDSAHVRFLNQRVGRRKVATEEVERAMAETFRVASGSLTAWVHRQFIAKFFGDRPHPFVLAMQHPSRATLLGYTIEHQHFLRQWARSCGFILARTDSMDVVRYELDNLATEVGDGGPGGIPHYELLLRMGESLGFPRDRTLALAPLRTTADAIAAWDRICREEPWVEAMAAMHGLELIAHRNLRKEGASLPYFDPALLGGMEITPAAQAFLREGYEADIGHSDAALALVERHADGEEAVQGVQATFLRSADLFDDYLIGRLERAAWVEAGR